MSGLPYLEADELQALFRFSNINSLYNAIQLGRLPVETYKIGGRIVADKEVVRQFFAQQREDGLKKLALKRAQQKS